MEKTKFNRTYEILNEVFNAVTHGIGTGLSIAGLVVLLVKFLPPYCLLCYLWIDDDSFIFNVYFVSFIDFYKSKKGVPSIRS